MDSPDLYRLVYTSTSNLLGSATEVRFAIEDLLVTARRNNRRDDITGALMFTEGNFAQVLEGAERDITALYSRLLADPRHEAVRLLALEPIRTRNFDGWSMAYVGADDDLAARYARMADDDDQNPGSIGSDRIVELIACHLANATIPT